MKRVPWGGLWVLVFLLLLLPPAASAQELLLSQTVEAVTLDGVFSALAPEGWYTAASDNPEDLGAMPVFATSEPAAEALLAGGDMAFPPDTIVIQVALPGALAANYGLALDVDALTAIDRIGPLIGEDFGTDLHLLPGLDSPHGYITLREWDYTRQGLTGGLLVVETDGGTLAFAMAYNTPAEVAEQALAAIAASARFAPTQNWTLEEGVVRLENPTDGSVFTVEPPDNWFISAVNDDTLVLATGEEAATAQQAGREGTLPPDAVSIQVLMPGALARTFYTEPGLQGQALFEALNGVFDPMYRPSLALAGLDAPHVLRAIEDTSGLPAGGNGALLLVDHGDGVSAWFILFSGSQAEMEALVAPMAQSATYKPG